MAPFPQLVALACGMNNITCFANATRASHATSSADAAHRPVATTPFTYSEEPKPPILEPREVIFAISLLCAFFGVIIGTIIFDWVRKTDFGKPRSFWGLCYKLGRAAFTKMKKLVKRPESAPDAGDVTPTTDGAPAAAAGEKTPEGGWA